MTKKMIQITLSKSGIGRPPKHRRTLQSLGLTKMNRTITRKDTPELRGMIRQISHLVEVKE
ncbi:MAG: 50S ribosomal protein L30 [Deltaproteobacteria bacterium]|nr:50S ribosomal protein L30 [Deltaproteobacteria bacterium]